MEIIDVDDKYVEWLRETFPSVLDPKLFKRRHSRKYVGIIFQISEFNYFAPFSSPKKKDYTKDGLIKKNSIFSLYMVKDGTDGRKILLGTIKLTNMIPVPDEYIRSYDVENEIDKAYKRLVLDEIKWIQKNQDTIIKKAKTIYYFKKNEEKNCNASNLKIYNSILPFELIEYHLKISNIVNKKSDP